MDSAVQPRPLWKIAEDISANWANVNFAAKPYLDAMRSLETVNSQYGGDNAKHIVMYFLSNSGTWRGDHAKRIKSELKSMIGMR